MKNAILMPGKPSEEKYFDSRQLNPGDSIWFPAVARSLTLNGYHAVRLEVPNPYAPDTEIWDQELERYPITPETILIGNSAGGGEMADWMSRHTEVRIHELFMVKPWLNPRRKYLNFCNTALDSELPDRCAKGVTIVHSSLTDDDQVKESLGIVHEAFQGNDRVRFVDVSEYGHQESDGRHVFPKLVELALGRAL